MSHRKLVALLSLLVLACVFPAAALSQAVTSESDDSAPISDPNSHKDLPEISVADKLAVQNMADNVAVEATVYVQKRKKSEAACLIRNSVRTAMSTWSQESYSWYIITLNEQLESHNVLQALGLKQRPHAASTTAQYQAELGLYGHKTLPASILSMIGPEAIRQGKLGDCWFLSTLAIIANDYPHVIPAMISVNEDASYTVKFPGYPNAVHVKALAFNSTRKIGSQSTEFGDWPFVIECAATAIYPEQMKCGGKANLALKLLTGLDSTIFAFSQNNNFPILPASDMSETIVAALETKLPIMLASKLNGPIPINHAYSVIDEIPANEEHGAMVTIRNPWGHLGFDPEASGLVEITPSGDGTFQMPIAALPKYFNDIVVPNNAIRSNSQVQQLRSSSSNLPVVPRSYVTGPVNQPNNPLRRVPKSYIDAQ